MSSRHSRLGIALLVIAVLGILTSTRTARAADVCTNASVLITLTNNAGTCMQNNSTTPIDVKDGKCVTYRAGANSLEVVYPVASSPFFRFSAAANQTVTTGPARGTPGTTFNYQSVTVNGQNCNNAKQLGIIMR
jgi:hypothetical protein